MTTVHTIVCDSCSETIEPNPKNSDSQRIDATTYGADLHRRCLGGLTALQLIVVLGLDDITMPDSRSGLDAGAQAKVCYSQWAKNDTREIEVRA